MDKTVLLPILNMLVAGLTRALHSDLPGSWNLSTKWRAFGLGILAAASGAFDLVGNGSTWKAALITSVATSGSGVAVLLMEAAFGAKNGSGPTGTGAIDLSAAASSIPPTPKLPRMAMVGLALVLALNGCSKIGTTGLGWPVLAKCSADVGDLVGTVGQILLSDLGKDAISESGKEKLQQLGIEHGFDTVVCIVDQLVKGWTSKTASVTPERSAAILRAQDFLAKTGTKIERVE